MNTEDTTNPDSSGSRNVKPLSQKVYGYQQFFQEFKIKDYWLLRTELSQMATFDNTMFEIPILIKHKVTERFSVLFGPQLNVFEDQSGRDFGVSFKAGMEYEVNTNWLLLGGYEHQVKSVYPKEHFKYGSKN